jgi:hypothetical protein
MLGMLVFTNTDPWGLGTCLGSILKLAFPRPPSLAHDDFFRLSLLSLDRPSPPSPCNHLRSIVTSSASSTYMAMRPRAANPSNVSKPSKRRKVEPHISKPFHRYACKPTEVIVEGNQIFYVHKELLASRTDLLVEEKTVVELPEVDARVFNIIIGWLYTNQISGQISWKDVVDIYAFAVEHGMTQLQNDTMDVFLKRVCKDGMGPPCDLMRQIHRIEDSSKLGKANILSAANLAKDLHNWHNLSMDKVRECFTMEILWQLVLSLFEARGVPKDFMRIQIWNSRCTQFHSHEGGQVCHDSKGGCDDDDDPGLKK